MASSPLRWRRIAILLIFGVGGSFLAAGDTREALRSPAFIAVGISMIAWNVAEALVLKTDEPGDYAAKRNTRTLQLAVLTTGLLGVVDYFHFPRLVPHLTVLAVIGGVIILLGGLLRVVAIQTLDRHFRYELRVESGQKLISTGPYRLLRHPSYTGLLLITLGLAVAYASLPALVLGFGATVVIMLIRIRDEERVLEAAFGAAYDEYRARTWRLVPYAY